MFVFNGQKTSRKSSFSEVLKLGFGSKKGQIKECYSILFLFFNVQL